MKYYTADLHFGHRNILKFQNRPFSSVEEMDECLIANWNKKIKRCDEVYILGDFGFVDGQRANDLLSALNGQKYLIKGNHDHLFLTDKNFDPSLFVWVKDYAHIKDDRQIICLFHYPIAVWDRSHHGSLHFYGHVHNNTTTYHPLLLNLGANAFNVGTDVCNYEPVSLAEILQRRNSNA